MLKVKIYTVGRAKERWLQEALLEYEKRLTSQVRVEWALYKTESELKEKIENETHWIALDPRGELFDSAVWSEKLVSLFEVQKSRLNFLIGGPDGIAKSTLKKSGQVWSLSPLTFTHQMTRLILLEQIYRALQIASGSSYHK